MWRPSPPHDTVESVGYAVTGCGRKAAVVTDLGEVTEAVAAGVKGAHLLVAEANHDVEWVKSGPYPYFLKSRILGDHGHLSNEAGAHWPAVLWNRVHIRWCWLICPPKTTLPPGPMGPCAPAWNWGAWTWAGHSAGGGPRVETGRRYTV